MPVAFCWSAACADPARAHLAPPAPPLGLPKPTIGQWAPIGNVGQLITLAVVVMVVDLLESTSIAR